VEESRPVIVCLVMVAIALALAAPAQAARPITLGTGEGPGLAIDEAGTAHIAWSEDLSDQASTLRYCRLPRGARACAPLLALPAPGFTAPGTTAVFAPRPGVVHIVASRNRIVQPSLHVLTSVDGGASFGPATPLGTVSGVATAAFGPGEGVLLMDNVAPLELGWFPFGSSAGRATVAFREYDGGLRAIVSDAGRPVVLMQGGPGPQPRVRTRVWNGTGDIGTTASWSRGPQTGPAASPSAAGGPRGAFVAYWRVRPLSTTLLVRRFHNGRFGRARAAFRARAHMTLALAQGPDGRLVLLHVRNRKVYSQRSKTGRRWSRPRRQARVTEAPTVGLGPRGGWIVGRRGERVIAVPLGVTSTAARAGGP
jgi:hypothetical protein